MNTPMPRLVFEIVELAQLIMDHLLNGGQRSLVSLACTCKALEEQALRTLWSNRQPSLSRLVSSTLPYDISSPRTPRPQVRNIVAV